MNRKGFTLTELLVVVVILGIIMGLSIPLIRNLSVGFEKRKYESYADSVLSAGKLFNDSYSEDLFGHNEYGCAYIPYEKLVERKLLNDIEIEGMSCNSNKTYIRVIKQKDKYAYKTFITCGPKTEGKITEETFSIPKIVPEMDENSCTGVNYANMTITADMSQATGRGDKNKKKTKLTITSGTGISNVINIYGKWSQDENDHANAGFNKVEFKVKENQEESLLNGDIITTTSKEILTPNGDGEYYLIVRVDHLQDLQGNSWRNPDNTESRYISFGPFIVDNTTPTINVVTFKCDASLNKTGPATGSKQVASGSTGSVYNLSNIDGTVKGWATSANYPNGVCIGFEIKDNLSIKSSKWEWNDPGYKENAQGYKTFDSEHVSTKTFETAEDTQMIYKSLSADGHRYARLTVKDYAGNKTTVDIDLKLDKTASTKPTITNTYNDKWTNKNVKVTLGSTDTLVGMGEYYYSYDANATGNGSDAATQWVKLNGGTDKTSFTTEEVWKNDMDRDVYIRSCDKVENCSETNSTRMKIDKTKPLPPTIENSSNGVWTREAVTLTLSAQDKAEGINTCAGLGEYYYSYTSGATGNGSDASTQWVKLIGGTDKLSFTTEPWAIGENNVLNETTYVRVCDKVGNCSDAATTDIKIDKIAPNKPTITNPNGNKWTNGLTMTIKSSDAHSGIGTYQYTYSADAPDDPVVTDSDGAETNWRIEPGATTTATSYDSAFSKDGDRSVYWRVCDKVGNCSEKAETHVAIEKNPPVCGTVTKTSTGTSDGVSGYVACSDGNGTYRSGCTSSTFSFSKLKSTSYVTIKDAAGNTSSCKVTVSCESHSVTTTLGYTLVNKGLDSINRYLSQHPEVKALSSGLCPHCKQKNASPQNCVNTGSTNYTTSQRTWIPYRRASSTSYYWTKVNGSTAQGTCFYDCWYMMGMITFQCDIKATEHTQTQNYCLYY